MILDNWENAALHCLKCLPVIAKPTPVVPEGASTEDILAIARAYYLSLQPKQEPCSESPQLA